MCDRRSKFFGAKENTFTFTKCSICSIQSLFICMRGAFDHSGRGVHQMFKCVTYAARIKEKLWFMCCSWLQPMQQLFMCVVIVSRYTWTVSYVLFRFVVFGGAFFVPWVINRKSSSLLVVPVCLLCINILHNKIDEFAIKLSINVFLHGFSWCACVFFFHFQTNICIDLKHASVTSKCYQMVMLFQIENVRTTAFGWSSCYRCPSHIDTQSHTCTRKIAIIEFYSKLVCYPFE